MIGMIVFDHGLGCVAANNDKPPVLLRILTLWQGKCGRRGGFSALMAPFWGYQKMISGIWCGQGIPSMQWKRGTTPDIDAAASAPSVGRRSPWGWGHSVAADPNGVGAHLP